MGSNFKVYGGIYLSGVNRENTYKTFVWVMDYGLEEEEKIQVLSKVKRMDPGERIDRGKVKWGFLLLVQTHIAHRWSYYV